MSSYYKSFLRGFSSQKEFRDSFSKEIMIEVQFLLNYLQKKHSNYKLFFFSEYSLDFPTKNDSLEIESRAKEIFQTIGNSPLGSGNNNILWYFIFSESMLITIFQSNSQKDLAINSTRLEIPKNTYLLSILCHSITYSFPLTLQENVYREEVFFK